MRWILFLLALYTSFSSAGTVATGYGPTYYEALADAKVRSLERDAGVFVVHKSTTTPHSDQYTTTQYTGGVISQYEILSSAQSSNGLYAVTIDATVKRNKNNIVNNNDNWQDDVKVIIGEQQLQRDFTPALNQQPMYVAQITKVGANVQQTNVVLTVEYEMKWSPKFLSDLKEYTYMAGRKVDITSSSIIYGVCYGTEYSWVPDNKCIALHSSIDRFEAPVMGRVRINLNDGSYRDATFAIYADQLHVATYNGRRIYFPSSGQERKFPKGVIVFTEGNIRGTVRVTLPSSIAKDIADLQLSVSN